MDLTTLGLKKPLTTEAYDIQIFNDNANKTNELILADREQINSLAAYAVASGINTYTATITGIAALTEGFSIKIKFTNANTGASTLNINSLGAKSILKGNGSALSSGNIKAGQICNLVDNGVNFQLLGEGGEYGTATASDVLSGKTVGTEEGLVAGTIPSKVAAAITPGTTNQVISAGHYLSGDQTIIGDADLISANIKAGVNIFGIAGNSNVVDTSAGTAIAADVLANKIVFVDGAQVTGNMVDRGTVNQSLTTQGQQYTIPAGKHSGSGKVTASFANLVAENIKSGVNVGGIVGSLIALNALTSSELKLYAGGSGQTGLFSDVYSDKTYTMTNGASWSSNAILIHAIMTIGNNVYTSEKLVIMATGDIFYKQLPATTFTSTTSVQLDAFSKSIVIFNPDRKTVTFTYTNITNSTSQIVMRYFTYIS